MSFCKFIFLASMLTIGLMSSAAEKNSNEGEAQLSTNVEFDPLTVHGRYQYADEATATVEDEKILHDLLGPRKDFKDRIRKSAKNR